MFVTTVKISDIDGVLTLARHYVFDLSYTSRETASRDALYMVMNEFKTARIVDNKTDILPNSGSATGCCVFSIDKAEEAKEWWQELGSEYKRWVFVRESKYRGQDPSTLSASEIEEIWEKHNIA